MLKREERPGLAVRIRGATKTYTSWGRSVEALCSIDLDVQNGEIAVIVGTNGSGKSTLLRAIAGMVPLDSGQVEIEGRDLEKLSPSKLARITGTLQQTPLMSLCTNFSVEEMIRLYLDGFPQQSRRSLRAALKMNGISLKGKVRELSGGQQQLLALELVLGRNPKLVLLDEPTASLDARHAKRILLRIAEAGREGVTVIFVSHNLEHGLDISQRLVFLHEGRVIRTWEGYDIEALEIGELREIFFQCVSSSLGES